MTKRTTKIVGKREISWAVDGFGRYWVESKPVNPKTGKGWQAGKYLYRGVDPVAALREFNAAKRQA